MKYIYSPGQTRTASQSHRCRPAAFKGFGLLEKPRQRQKSLEPELEAWLQRHGLPDQKVELTYYEEAGRGLQSLSSFRKGEKLLKIPQRLLLTPEAALHNSRVGKISEAADLPGWSILAVALCEARYGDSEGWKPYAEALPSTSGSVLEWDRNEIQSLRGSPMYNSAKEIVKAAEDSLQELQPIIKKAEADNVLQQGVITDSRLRWAFSMLLSRLVRLPGLRNTEALCPWADMVNHDCRATTHLDFDSSSKTATLVTDRSYKSGEQVMASYGSKTSGQLLLSYGFAPSPKDNPHDACLLKLSVAEDDPHYKAKAASLQKFGFSVTQEFPLKMEGLPNGILQFAAFADAEPGDPAEVAELADWLFARGQFPKLDGVDTELLGAEVLREECKIVLGKYPESMEQNQRYFKGRSDPSEEESGMALEPKIREGLIRSIKLQEQKILQRTSFSLQQRIKALS